MLLLYFPITFCRTEILQTFGQISFWKMCVKKYPNNIAIENEEYKLTYAELDIKTSELRSAIIEEGCKEKDKIAIIGDNTIECVLQRNLI